jgi:hypothetical protein
MFSAMAALTKRFRTVMPHFRVNGCAVAGAAIFTDRTVYASNDMFLWKKRDLGRVSPLYVLSREGPGRRYLCLSFQQVGWRGTWKANIIASRLRESFTICQFAGAMNWSAPGIQ